MTQVRYEYLRILVVLAWYGNPDERKPPFRLLNYTSIEKLVESCKKMLQTLPGHEYDALVREALDTIRTEENPERIKQFEEFDKMYTRPKSRPYHLGQLVDIEA